MSRGYSESLTLQAVADVADRWNVPGVSPETFAHKRDVLTDYCDRFGRDLDDIELTVLQTAVIRESAEAARDAHDRLREETAAGPSSPDDYRGFVGTPEDVLDAIGTFADEGAKMVMLRAERNDPETIDHLVEMVVPTVD